MPVLFALTMFVGATLLFVVQPMFARMALPLLGGSPAVWNTAVLFYQAALLAGYGYAHLTTRWLGARRQAALHAALLLLPLLVLPIGVPEGWRPPAEETPVWWFLGLLAVAVGLPFFVVATTSPLLQAWVVRTRHRMAADPYPLYAASNVGSIVALLAYPTFVEPTLSLAAQSQVWAAGYVVLALLTFGCAWVVWRSNGDRRLAEALGRPAVPLSVARRARWVLLAFAPSSLMLSVTTYLSTNIAPIPLLWTLPLALYLLTFVLTFSGEVFPHAGMVRALPIVLLLLTVVLAAQATAPLELLMPLHLLVFFVAAMVCHGELARDRPPPEQLTEFYLWLSVGGVLGGLFNAIVAPLLFTTVVEYPLVLVLVCLLLPASDRRPAADEEQAPAPPEEDAHPAGRPSLVAGRWLDVALPLGLGLLTAGLVLAVQRVGLGSEPAGLGLMFALPAALCFTFAGRPLRLGLGVAAILLASSLYVSDQGRVLYAARSFFGIHRVLLDPSGRFHLLAHGTTLHGMQSLDPAERRVPLSYFYPSGPAGQLFEQLGPTRRSVAVVGLGVGSLACYGRPGQEWTFYEIDPLVEQIARDGRFFSFLSECGVDVRVVLGDARLKLEEAPAGSYDLLVMDAYTSDAIPIHLMTREALGLYLERLAPGGAIAFHISNQYFDLRPVLAALASERGLAALAQDDLEVSEEEAARGKRGSQWVVLAREPEVLAPLAATGRWYELTAPPGAPVWTDDYSSVLSVLKLGNLP